MIKNKNCTIYALSVSSLVSEEFANHHLKKLNFYMYPKVPLVL